jgi:hypothetical protein
VWKSIQDTALHAEWHPHVNHIGGDHELGAVRQCSVNVRGKAGHTEEVCSLYEENRKIMWEIKKDSTGFSEMVTDWSAGFTLQDNDGKTTLVIAKSEFRPKNLLVNLMTPMIAYKFHQVQKEILLSLKQYTESN